MNLFELTVIRPLLTINWRRYSHWGVYGPRWCSFWFVLNLGRIQIIFG